MIEHGADGLKQLIYATSPQRLRITGMELFLQCRFCIGTTTWCSILLCAINYVFFCIDGRDAFSELALLKLAR